MLRKLRGWTQGELAERSGLTQGAISRAEDQDYGNLTVNTILTIAQGFDLAFVGRFVPFSELEDWYMNLSQDTLHAPSFEEENESAVSVGPQLPLAEPDELSEALRGSGGRFTNAFGTEVYEPMKGNTRFPYFDQARILNEGLLSYQNEGGTNRATIGHSLG